MITQERALETLERFNIDEAELLSWEQELGLEIPRDKFGNKVYSPLHLNLFKNVKKHLALGRSLVEIKRMVVLPNTGHYPEKAKPNRDDHLYEERRMVQAQQQEIRQDMKSTLSQRLLREISPQKTTIEMDEQAVRAMLPSQSATQRQLKRFSSRPARITTSRMVEKHGPNAGLLVLIDRLVEEKDNLQNTLVQMEKQKSHLYHVNEMFRNRVAELTDEIAQLQQQLQSKENLKLIDDKSKLQRQLIDAEQRQANAEKELMRLNGEMKQLKDALSTKIDPKIFVGNWLEEADLEAVAFDNFGINIESKRSRMFRVTQPPTRFFGHTGIIETTYDYQTNTLWKRTETLILNVIHENRLEGELIAEYILDGTPVARATYRVRCHRNGVKAE